jgi:RimJ/RimL family protein N-acetyltransferase
MPEPSDGAPADPQPTIGAGSFVLRPWRSADDVYVVKAFADPAIRRWSGRRIESPEQAAGWIAGWTSAWETRSAAGWAITPAEDLDVVVGQVALRTLWVGEMAEVSYWVLPDHRGLGIAPRATHALATWALRDEGLGLTRLELAHSVRNRASCRAARKAGFTAESYKRSLQKHESDEVHDMHVHAVVRPAQVRVRTLDTALLGVVSQVRLWLAVAAANAALMLLTLVSPLALIVPLLVAAGVLGLYTGTVRRPRWRYRRRSRQDAVS